MTVLEEIQQAIKAENIVNAMRVASRSTLRESSNRIFQDGLDSNNKQIGEYSKRPLVVMDKDSPVKVGEGGDDGKFFPGGYKQFRKEIGREYEKVNLSDPDMAFAQKKINRCETDFQVYREGASGANGGKSGGGCGCN